MTTGTQEPMSGIPMRFWQRRMRIANPTLRNPLTIIGLVIAVAWIVIAIFAPLLAPHNPLDDSFPSLHAPSWQYPFGTDEIGRDVLSRVIYGSRQTIPLGLLLVGISLAIGATFGAIAGFFGGIVDGLVMRLSDLVFAFPPIVLAMVTTAALGRARAQRGDRDRHRQLAHVRARRPRARPAARGVRLRARLTPCSGPRRGGRCSGT